MLIVIVIVLRSVLLSLSLFFVGYSSCRGLCFSASNILICSFVFSIGSALALGLHLFTNAVILCCLDPGCHAARYMLCEFMRRVCNRHTVWDAV